MPADKMHSVKEVINLLRFSRFAVSVAITAATVDVPRQYVPNW